MALANMNEQLASLSEEVISSREQKDHEVGGANERLREQLAAAAGVQKQTAALKAQLLIGQEELAAAKQEVLLCKLQVRLIGLRRRFRI